MPVSVPTLLRHLKAFISQRDRYDYLIFVSILIYAIVFSYFTCLKHYTFSSYAGDLGIFNQAFYTTVFHGKLFYYTVENYVNPSSTYFAIHFSPILFTLVPFYAINPRPETLLILQSWILALGAFPLYLMVKETVKDKKLALLAGLAYLLYPALQGANWFDFHPQAFYPLLIFSMYYFFVKERWVPYTIFTLLTLMVMEWSVFMLIVLSANLLLMELRLDHFKSLKGKTVLATIKCLVKRKKIVILTSTIALAVAWWFFVDCIQNTFFPLDPNFRPFIRATKNWKVLFGTESGDFEPLLQIPLYTLFHPQQAFNALLYDYHIKFLFIMLLFAPLLFIPFRSKLVLSSIALLIPALLSNHRELYMIGNQKALHILPLVFLAFVDGLKNIPNGKKLGSSLMIATLLFIVSTSPISPMSYAFLNEVQLLWYPKSPLTVNENVESMHQMIKLIPSNASVLATNSLFPHVSNRLNAYAIPAWVWDYNPSMVAEYLSHLINKSDYVLLRVPECRTGEGSYVLSVVSNDPSFSIYAIGGEALLFKRGYNGEVIDLRPYPKVFLATQDLSLGQKAIKVEFPSPVVFYPKVVGEGTVVYGPYIVLPPGTYRVTFTIKVMEEVEGHVATLDIANNYGKEILAKKYVYGFMLKSQEWIDIALIFHSDKLLTSAEFRVFASGLADLYVSKVTVERLQLTDAFSMTFNYKDLLYKGNTTSDKGLLLHPRSFTDDVFWYGPYVTLPPGRYEVSFYLKVLPNPKEGDRILTLDVVSDFRKGLGIMLSKIDVNDKEMKDLGSGWYEVKVAFDAETELRDVEFRGLRPSPNYDIYLAYIYVERVSS
jgi:uncharacterized membrane protein